MANAGGSRRAPDEKYWREVLSGERRGFKYDATRAGLSLLELIYAAGLSLYLGAERVGLRHREKFDIPVVSIGNLSVGGTGKTPATQWLARKLLAAGYRPAVLNRGHGGLLAPNSAVVSDEAGNIALSAAEAGDEAVLLARSLPGIPVIVGKDRRISGRMAIDRFACDVIVLDDGFQYWQLDRDLDIVLLDSRRPFDNGHALPRGFLREPASNLGRAGVAILTRASSIDPSQREALTQRVKAITPSISVFDADHVPDGVVSGNRLAEGRQPERALLVSGIAQPASFEALAKKEGIVIMSSLSFPDHQSYHAEESGQILRRMNECGADSVLTTEKDAVKMADDFIDVPLFVLKIRFKPSEEQLLWETVRLRAGLVESLYA